MWENSDAAHDVQDTNWWWGKARMEIVQECMKDLHGNVLEVGAGYGIMTKMLSQFGKVKAIEPYPDAVSYLRKLKIDAYCGTLESFDGADKYDIVTCFDVLEHIEDDQKALYKMGSLLKENGFLVLTVPAYKFLWNRHDEINHHYRRYTKEELIKLLPPDLKVKRVTYFNTFLFPLAVVDKLFLSKNKGSYSLNPNKLVDKVLYRIFATERTFLRFCNFPFGVSILLIAEKTND